jgi:hypothetical protein
MSNPVQELEKFTVAFFNPITKILHSSWAVEAEDGVKAVAAAAKAALESDLRGSDVASLATFDAAVTDSKGKPAGIGAPTEQDRAQSKDDLLRKFDLLRQELDALDDDADKVDPVVEDDKVEPVAEDVADLVTGRNSGTSFPPLSATPPQSSVVDPSAAPRINPGGLSS